MPNLNISTHELAETSSSLLELLKLSTNKQNKKRFVTIPVIQRPVAMACKL